MQEFSEGIINNNMVRSINDSISLMTDSLLLLSCFVLIKFLLELAGVDLEFPVALLFNNLGLVATMFLALSVHKNYQLKYSKVKFTVFSIVFIYLLGFNNSIDLFLIAILIVWLAVQLERVIIKVTAGIKFNIHASMNDTLQMIAQDLIFVVILLILSRMELDLSKLSQTLMMILKNFDSIALVGIVLFFNHYLWSQGIHGGAVTGFILNTFYIITLSSNMNAYLLDQPLPFIITGPLSVSIFVMGGAGATLGLNGLLLFSQDQELREIGKVSGSTSIFGINETILYGLPILDNKHFKIPFLLTPIVNLVISYFLIKEGIFNQSFLLTPWNIPPMIGIVVSSLSFKNLGLFALIFIIDALIYLPFYVKYKSEGVIEE